MVFIVASPVPAQSRGGTHRTAGNAPGMNAWHQTQHMRDTDKSCDSLLPSDTLRPSWVPPTVLPDRIESQFLPRGTQGSVQGTGVDAASPGQNTARAPQRCR